MFPDLPRIRDKTNPFLMQTPTFNVMVVERSAALKSEYWSYIQQCPGFLPYRYFTHLGLAMDDMVVSAPDIVILALKLQGFSGVEATRLLRRRHPKTQVLMVGDTNDFDIIKKAFKNGANGYLTKPLSQDKMAHALTSLKEDGAAISNDLVKQFIATFQRKTYPLFSERENQIVEYLCKGATYKMIAKKLFVTPSTVNFHIQNIYVKLNVNSKAEALHKLEQL